MVIGASHTTDRPGFRVGLEPGVGVIWLTGEHDIATSPALRVMLIDLIALDERDITVDLSEAIFVGSVVIGELQRAREHLLGRDRTLTVRDPSAFVRRTFTICHAEHLIAPTPSMVPSLHVIDPNMAASTP